MHGLGVRPVMRKRQFRKVMIMVYVRKMTDTRLRKTVPEKVY